MAGVARAIGARSAPQALFDLLKSVGAPTGLKEIGMPEDGVERVVELALTNPYYNPAPLEAGRLRVLVENAIQGNEPAAIDA